MTRRPHPDVVRTGERRLREAQRKAAEQDARTAKVAIDAQRGPVATGDEYAYPVTHRGINVLGGALHVDAAGAARVAGASVSPDLRPLRMLACRWCGQRYHTDGGLEAHQFVVHGVPMTMPGRVADRAAVRPPILIPPCQGCPTCPCTHTRSLPPSMDPCAGCAATPCIREIA